MAGSDQLVQGVALFTAAAAIGFSTMPFALRALAWLGAGKQIREEGPASHQVKAGTPSMGGVIFLGLTAALGSLFLAPNDASVATLLVLMTASAILGTVDDLLSSARYKRRGIRARPKLAWQAGIAAGAVLLEWTGPGLPPQHIPGLGTLHASWAIALIALLAIISTTHSVNLTDGIDGLAGTTTSIALAAFAVIAYHQGQDTVGALCLLTMGAVSGFLWYNVHPARLFMGDAGSLGLGSLIGGLGLVTGQLVALIPICVVFAAESLSVIIQVTYFKRTGGKRIFRMSPIHHHFEALGWPETQIVQRFMLVGLFGALVGLALAF
jgi:phospho-N-acetylmuramoyl-pentapeptide-transferase